MKISCIDRKIEQKLLNTDKVGKTPGKLARKKKTENTAPEVERPEALRIDEVPRQCTQNGHTALLTKCTQSY